MGSEQNGEQTGTWDDSTAVPGCGESSEIPENCREHWDDTRYDSQAAVGLHLGLEPCATASPAEPADQRPVRRALCMRSREEPVAVAAGSRDVAAGTRLAAAPWGSPAPSAEDSEAAGSAAAAGEQRTSLADVQLRGTPSAVGWGTAHASRRPTGQVGKAGSERTWRCPSWKRPVRGGLGGGRRSET
ncbi:hypothetical protein A1Q2_04251 [Trichosporon asahii var. asahii CBS 8904]|uniref:Uncharacterized protein n=1 Tax=Trichosporon asahii var. asahii (strain CBS 8904) TaxID=1220162 RepID=K1WIZ7_TRIAC|nr:hypothetical protein A1Q2_04251 [Trichosporon asahii var. asahii CBS 8904]